MGCGCKNKKKRADAAAKAGQTNTQADILERRQIVQDQQNYQTKVKDALKQLMEIRKRKQNLRK